MPRSRQCLRCGALTSRPSSRGLCPSCQGQYEQARPARATYDDPRWRRLSAEAIRRWVREHGWWCPGYGREGHASRDLTADHSAALAAGGAGLDPRNVRVLCRECNGRKAAASDNRQER